jgi:hypothetical protein
MIALCFLVLPFTYFYAEETLESGDDMESFLDEELSDEELDSSYSTKTGNTRRNSKGEGRMIKIWDRTYKAIRQTVKNIPLT